MKHYREYMIGAAVIAASTVALMTTPARATSASGFTATQIAKGVYGTMDLNADKDRDLGSQAQDQGGFRTST